MCLTTKQSWSDQMSQMSGLRTCSTWLPNKWDFYCLPKRHGVRTLGLDLTLEDEGLYLDQIMEEDLNAPKRTQSSAHTESHPPRNAMDVVVDTRTEWSILSRMWSPQIGIDCDNKPAVCLKCVFNPAPTDGCIMIGSPEYMWDILLADTVEWCLLGSEFLHETGCIIEMEKAHLTARDHLTGSQARQNDYYNRTAREQRFEVGDFSVQTRQNN